MLSVGGAVKAQCGPQSTGSALSAGYLHRHTSKVTSCLRFADNDAAAISGASEPSGRRDDPEFGRHRRASVLIGSHCSPPTSRIGFNGVSGWASLALGRHTVCRPAGPRPTGAPIYRAGCVALLPTLRHRPSRTAEAAWPAPATNWLPTCRGPRPERSAADHVETHAQDCPFAGR